MSTLAGRFAIEFRSGSYFVDQSRDRGGSRDEARTWTTRAAAQRYLHGGRPRRKIMSTNETAETFATWLLDQAAIHRQSIARMVDRLTDDSPASALAASESPFGAAARAKVFSWCAASLGAGLSLQELKSRALKETVSRARGGSSSTSVTENLMERCITEAWAEVVVALGADR